MEIERDFAEDARSLDLDRHVFPVGSEGAAVDLADARGGDGAGGEGGEDGGEVGDAEFGAEDVVGFGGGERRDGVLELAEFEGIGLGEDVGADGEGLAEFDAGNCFKGCSWRCLVMLGLFGWDGHLCEMWFQWNDCLLLCPLPFE